MNPEQIKQWLMKKGEIERIGEIIGGIFKERVRIAQVNLKLGIGVSMRPTSVIDLARTILKIDTALAASRKLSEQRRVLLDETRSHLEFAKTTYSEEFNDYESCAVIAELLEKVAKAIEKGE